MLRVALSPAHPTAARGHTSYGHCAERVSTEPMSAFRRTIAILRPYSWLTFWPAKMAPFQAAADTQFPNFPP